MEEWHRVALREAFAFHLATDQAESHRHGLGETYTELTITIARGLHDLGMATEDTNTVTEWADRIGERAAFGEAL